MSNLLRQDSLQDASTPPLAVKATEALRRGDFKQAIELFKRLVRQDARPEWREALAQAFVGRARLLAARGLFEEAEIALNKAAAPDGTVPDPLLHVQCLVKRGQVQKAAGLAIKYVGNDKISPRLAELAAALWLVAPAPLPDPADQTSGKWAEHAAAAQQILTAWIEGKPPQEIDRSLGRIPLRSPFGALRLILKSLLTAADDPERARRLLDGIPPDSAFASLRLAVEAALPGKPVDPTATPVLPSKAQQMFAAQVKELPRDASESHMQLIKAERSGPGALLSFLASRAGSLPADDVRQACLNLLPQAPHRLRQFETTFGPLPEFDRSRVLALAAEAANDLEKAERYWTEAARRVEAAAGPQARLESGVIYRHLARLSREHGMPEAEIKYLELGLRADPDYLAAVLQLIGLYRTHGQDRDWHRLAEEAARRFPKESAALLQATDAAIARKSYKKAVGFARRLLALDPINRAARARMIELYVSHARKQMRAKKPDLASKALADAAQWEQPGAPSFLLRINQGLLGLALGQRDAEARLRQGVELAGGGVPGWFRASLEHELLKAGEPGATLLREELTRVRQTAAPTKEAIQLIVSAVSLTETRESKLAAAGLIFRIRSWLLKGAGLAWSASEFHALAEMFAKLNAYDLVGDYAMAAGRRDPNCDATWRYYEIVARVRGEAVRLSNAELEELFDMEEAALSRSDFHAVNRIRRFVKGSGAGSTRRRSRRPAVADDVDDVEVSVEALLTAVLGEAPGAVIKTLVEKLGKREAITVLVDRLRSTSFGSAPTPVLRQFAEQLIDLVMSEVIP